MSCVTALLSFSGSSLQAPSCVRDANPFDCLCTNGCDLVGLDQSSWKQSHGTALGSRSPACTRASLLRPGGPYTRKHTTTEPVSVTAGRVSAESAAPFEVSGQKKTSEGAAFLFSLAVGFVIGVSTCETLCCTKPPVFLVSVGNFFGR